MPNMEVTIDPSKPGRFTIPTLKHTSVGQALIGTPTAVEKGLPYHLGDLDEPILPLFKRSNFPGWNYEVIQPALRLASRLMDAPCLFDFLDAMLWGKEKELPSPDNTHATYRAWFRRKDSLSAFDIARIRLHLCNLAEMVRFHLQPDLGCGAITDIDESGCLGRGSLLLEGALPRYRNIITFDAADYQCLCDADNTRDYGFESFCFASLLCHELLHAAYPTDGLMPFEHNLAAETGYEFENHIWGGIPGDGPHITDWPAPTTVLRYLHNDWKLVCFKEPPRVQVNWALDEHFVERLFTNFFWEVWVPNTGASALKPTRDQGWRVKVLDNGDVEPFDLCSDDLEEGEGVPAGFELDGHGYIVPIDWWERDGESSWDETEPVKEAGWETY